MSEAEYRIDYSPEEIQNYIDIMRIRLGVRNIEFQPHPTRGLYAQLSATPDQCTVRTRCDFSIAPSVLINHHWEIEQLFFTRRVTEQQPGVVIVDIGANIGLYSRQILGWTRNIHRLFAYEPERENFACLLHNLSPFGNVTAQMVGLADHDGATTLHVDRRNCGNNSLVSGELGGAWDKSTVEVDVRDIARESRRWLEPGLPIFYKSDTQGYDELLVTLLPDDIRAALIGGIVEIEPGDKPPFSLERWRSFLDLFQHKVVLRPNESEIPVTTEQTMNMMENPADVGMNIAFWR